MFKNGLNVVSMPTPIISSNSNPLNDEPLKIGYHSVLNLPEGSTAQFLELNGNSLVILQNSIKDMEAKMFVIGSKLLEPDKKVGESAEAIRLNQISEIGILNGVIDSLNNGFKILNDWYGHVFEVLGDVKLNKNFIQKDLTKDILNVSSQLYAQGILSKEMILRELQRNELFLSPDDDIDEIISSHTFIDSRGLTE